MFTLAQWIARLTKGYIRHTGKKPDGLAYLKIKLEAAQKVKDQSKVIKGKFNPKEEWWKSKEKAVKKRDRPSIRLMKNFDQELDDITLAKEGYNLQEIGIIKRARQVMKDEGQNPDDALSWVRSEMADDAGIDFEDFMTDFDWGDFPGKAEGGRIGLKKGSESWRQKLTRWAGGSSALAGELGLEGIHQMQSLLGLGGLYSGGGSVGHAPWHKPTAQQQPQPQGQPQPGGAQSPGRGPPNPMKGPRGLPSVAPRTMDPAFMQQQMMQKAMMGQGQQRGQPRMGRAEGGMTQEDFNQFLKEREEMYREGGKHELEKDWKKYKRFKQYGQGAIQEAAQGGRIGMMYGGDPGFAFEYGGSWADWRDQHQHQMPITDYIKTKLPKERLPFRDMQSGGIARLPLGLGSMSRRAFMKMLAALGIGTAAAKSGISLLSKTAPKTIKAVETITRGADGMPKYISDLIEVVKAKGTKDFIEGFKKSDYSTVHRYKGVEVIDEAGGTTRIKKSTEGVAEDASTGKMHEGVSQEVHMEISPQYREQFDADSGLSWYKDADGKKVYETKIPDEYMEGTVHPDMDGKMKDFVEGIDDLDHLELKKIADEVDTLIIKKTKKASGGLAHMLGE